MSDPATQESTYTMGYSDDFQQVLDRRSVHTHAAHLLPHLKPGLRILDFGCGPGTISVGLSRPINSHLGHSKALGTYKGQGEGSSALPTAPQAAASSSLSLEGEGWGEGGSHPQHPSPAAVSPLSQ